MYIRTSNLEGCVISERETGRSQVILEPVIDRCHICGRMTKLSFEHVPPRSAFNNTGVLIADMNFEQPLTVKGVPQGARIFQLGMGSYSLCPKCNSDTGT